MMSQTGEQAFEYLIEKALVGSTVEERKAAVERQISSDMTNFGIIKLLSEGIDVDNIHLALFFPKPFSADSKASHAKYAKDLLDSVDLNTYGLRRTALNETIVLDAGESTIDPLKPTMVNAGPTDEPEKDPLDEIIKEFNEHWFRGWEATPDDQKEKLVNITKAVANDADYQSLVIGNPDQQAVSAAMAMIIDRVIRQKRKGDMSLYREYQQNEAFKAGFRSLITRMLDNLEYL